ncbi:hypothetical protein ACTXKZ_03200 [Brachybacterium alimentarium]|uniref:hypothetical protein n=1 Tax=Brachybacterium alimentarium TaxID=47845 RepID=UPI003FCF19D8
MEPSSPVTAQRSRTSPATPTTKNARDPAAGDQRRAGREPGWRSEVLGLRPGFVISGHRKVGTFRRRSGAN